MESLKTSIDQNLKAKETFLEKVLDTKYLLGTHHKTEMIGLRSRFFQIEGNKITGTTARDHKQSKEYGQYHVAVSYSRFYKLDSISKEFKKCLLEGFDTFPLKDKGYEMAHIISFINGKDSLAKLGTFFKQNSFKEIMKKTSEFLNEQGKTFQGEFSFKSNLLFEQQYESAENLFKLLEEITTIIKGLGIDPKKTELIEKYLSMKNKICLAKDFFDKVIFDQECLRQIQISKYYKIFGEEKAANLVRKFNDYWRTAQKNISVNLMNVICEEDDMNRLRALDILLEIFEMAPRNIHLEEANKNRDKGPEQHSHCFEDGTEREHSEKIVATYRKWEKALEASLIGK